MTRSHPNYCKLSEFSLWFYALTADHVHSLARIYNALPHPILQREFGEWSLLEFPEKWQKIGKLKKNKTIKGVDRILIPPELVRAN